MSVSNDGRLLDGAVDIVVGEAELISQMLNVAGRALHVIINHRVASRSGHALSSSHRDEVELVSVLVSDGCINDSAGVWIHEAAWVASEQSSVDSLRAVQVHQLRRISDSGI